MINEIKNYKALEITEEEKEAYKTYRGINHIYLALFLNHGLEVEDNIKTQGGYIKLDKKTVENSIDKIAKVYSALVKYSIKNPEENITNIYRGTNLEEIRKMDTFKQVGKPIFATTDKEKAEEYYLTGIKEKVVITLNIAGKVPYARSIDILGDIDEDIKDELVIGPFTKVLDVKEIAKYQDKKFYVVTLDKLDLPQYTEKELLEARKKCSASLEGAAEALDSYFSSNEEYVNLNLKRDMHTTRLTDKSMDKTDRQDVTETIDKIAKEMDETQRLGVEAKEKYCKWKSNILTFFAYKFAKIEKEIEEELLEERNSVAKTEKEKLVAEKVAYLKEQKADVLALCESNELKCTSIVNKLVRVKNRQESFNTFAEKLGIEYLKFTNIQKNILAMNNLLEKLSVVSTNIKAIDVSYDTTKDQEYSDKISKINRTANISKELEKRIIEILEREMKNIDIREIANFKKGIYYQIEQTKASYNMSKINAERAKIINRSSFLKIIDQFTGKAEINQVTLEQLDIKQASINNKLTLIKNEDRANYSIHQMMADIDIYIEENADNKRLAKIVKKMRDLRKGTNEVFKIEEDKVQIAKDKRLKTALPISLNKRRLSKEERIIEETNIWLSKNGYISKEQPVLDSMGKHIENPLAYEANRIVEDIDNKINSRNKEQRVYSYS